MSGLFPISRTRLRAQIIKELLSILRDPRSRMVLVGPPLMQLLIFSFAATLDVTNVDLGIFNRDSGRASQEFVAAIAASNFVGDLHVAHSARELRELIDTRQAIAVVEIPPTFSRDASTGRAAVAQVTIDGRRANAGQLTLGYLSAIAANTGLQLARDGTPMAEPSVVRHWFNANRIYRWFIVPGLSGILSTFIALLVTALSIARERELGTFDQLLVSPTTTLEIIISKTVPALIIGTVLGTVMICAGIFLFGIPFRGSFPLLFGCLVLFILSMVGIGLMISSVSSSQQQAILGTFAVAVPSVLMSGFATPVENMPVFLQYLAQAIPLKHFLIIVQGSFTKGMPLVDVLHNTWPMAVIAVVTLSAAGLFVRSKLQ
ncbi:MAG: ABC transporter permease [Xanthomonadales bacterium]|nr:ABC transporter permease [Xanthomonadales bacterium]